MKKIKMKIDKKGSQDGVTLRQFKEGEDYTITDWLADVFLKENWAEEILTPEILKKETIITPEKIAKPKRKIKRKKINEL